MNTFRAASLSIASMCALVITACGDTSTAGTDASTTRDAGGEDAAVSRDVAPDTSGEAPVDAGPVDAGPVDATSDMGEDAMADVGEDASRDAGADAMLDAGEDAGDMVPDPGCVFLDLNVRYVTCEPGQDYQILRYFEDRNLGDARCPPYFTLRGTRYETAEDALAGETCDGTCAWSPTRSYTVLRCGRRTGYEQWTAADCEDIYVTPDGVYPSVEAWEFSNPCP